MGGEECACPGVRGDFSELNRVLYVSNVCEDHGPIPH